MSRIWIVALLALATSTSMAQESSGIPIQFAGRIAAVNGTTVTVNQLQIEISDSQVSIPLEVDSQVVIRGILLDSGTVAAQTITVYLAPTPTPAAIPATFDPAILSVIEQTPSTIVIEGVVQRIEDGRLWINGMSLDYDPDDPIFAALQVGDVLRIEGMAVQVGDTQTINVTDVRLIGRASDDDDEEDNDEPEGMGMGMGMGMGD